MELLILFQIFYFFELCLARRKGVNDSKIVGGWGIEDITDYPGIVSIQKAGGHHECGGCLLTPYYVVTTCQCLADIFANPPKLKVFTDYVFIVGTKDLLNIGQGQKREAKRFLIHPSCHIIKGVFPMMDYGVAEMQTNFVSNQYVRPMAVYSMDPNIFTWKFNQMIDDHTSSCFIAGWGESNAGVKGPSQMTRFLKMLQMYIVDNDDCEDMYQSRFKLDEFNFEKNGQLCASSRNFKDTDCHGDRGGPFICGVHLVAIISTGIDCDGKTPRILAILTPFLEWFTKSVQQHGKVAKPREDGSHTSKPFYMLIVFAVVLVIVHDEVQL